MSSSRIPNRILPVCAKPPSDLPALFDVEFADIKRMVAPGSRKRLDAKAKLRSLAILQASLDGRRSQPSERELDMVVNPTRIVVAMRPLDQYDTLVRNFAVPAESLKGRRGVDLVAGGPP